MDWIGLTIFLLFCLGRIRGKCCVVFCIGWIGGASCADAWIRAFVKREAPLPPPTTALPRRAARSIRLIADDPRRECAAFRTSAGACPLRVALFCFCSQHDVDGLFAARYYERVQRALMITRTSSPLSEGSNRKLLHNRNQHLSSSSRCSIQLSLTINSLWWSLYATSA